MSYRAIKRLLGETSLERKCRFLFGGGLMLLITGSFYFYAQLNMRVLKDQNRERARLLVSPRLLARHSEVENLQLDPAFKEMHDELLKLDMGEELTDKYKFHLYKPTADTADATARPADMAGHQAIARLRSMFEDGEELLELDIEHEETKTYRYYQGLLASESCLKCHHHSQADLAVGDFIGVAEVVFPLEATTLPVQRNNAILIAMALITASLAMLAAYVIVRYVIVKPVLHLQDVSDAIAHGDLDQRADIRTGDGSRADAAQ